MDAITQKAFSLLGKIKFVSFATINNGEPDAGIANVMLTFSLSRRTVVIEKHMVNQY